MGAAREKDQADFDLERFIDMFDEAMTSQDPRVIETLRSLLMIVTLTRSETNMNHGRSSGPLRRLFEDMQHLNNRLHRAEDTIRDLQSARHTWPERSVYSLQDEKQKYASVAAAQLAQSIDDDIIKKFVREINGGTTKGLK